MDTNKTLQQLSDLLAGEPTHRPSHPQESRRGISALLHEIEDTVLHNVGSQKLQEQIASLLKLDGELDEKRRRQLYELSLLLQQAGPPDAAASIPSKGGGFTLDSTDPLRLTLSVWPAIGPGQPVTVKMVADDLRARGVRSVRVQALRDALARAQNGEAVTDVVIATGRAPQPGADGVVEYFARPEPDAELAPVNPDHLRAADLQAFCNAGDRIARLTPPTPGADGVSVLGKPLPAEPGHGEPPEAGKHAILRDNEVIADATGVVRLSHNRLDVETLLVIPADLRASHGPIEFEGDVLIRGAVRSNATLTATGSIEVFGNVEAASLKTRDGDIRLHRGVAGRGAATIESGRDIITKFAENAHLVAARDIVLQVGALHCHLVAGRHVTATQDKGHIGGGSVSACEGIRVKRLGLRSGVPMEIILGVPMAVTVELARLERERLALQAKQQRTKELIERMTYTVGDITRFSSDELQAYTRLKQLLLLLELEGEGIAERRLTMLSALPPVDDAPLEVAKEVLSEITLAFGRHREHFSPSGGRAVFRYLDDSGRIMRLT